MKNTRAELEAGFNNAMNEYQQAQRELRELREVDSQGNSLNQEQNER